MTKAVFLDRDGTLIQDLGYICHFHQVGFFPFASAAVRALNEAGYLVIVVSNQSAVARGICNKMEIELLHRELQDHFKNQGAVIAAFYFCPFLADAAVLRYRCDSPMRKPAPGMLLQAAGDFKVDLPSSFMIGDKIDDIRAGQKAGCRTVLVRTGQGRHSEISLQNIPPPVDHVVDDLLAASTLITSLAGPEEIERLRKKNRRRMFNEP
ncbi:MAG: HAD family hydrolase [Candidatus Aminicenantes bacterium]|nr:HAD family hydrolase [Candidatus Aminicenantes bacterium]